MHNASPQIPSPVVLGIEGGATHTVCLLVDGAGVVLQRHEAGPANILLLSDAQFLKQLKAIKSALAGQPIPRSICLALAGAHGGEEFARIRSQAVKVWQGIPLHVTHDLESAITADEIQGPDKRKGKAEKAKVLVLSGTGACFLGKAPNGKWARFGGWGHVIGDKGSGYEIGLRALKATTFYYDRDGTWTRLGQRILRALQMNDPRDLIPWSPHASKNEIAVLAKEVFAAAKERDGIAKDILDGAVASLAKDAVSCARKLVGKGSPVKFIFAGSVVVRQPAFARRIAKEIRARWPNAECGPLKTESVWGAVVLAQRVARKVGLSAAAVDSQASATLVSRAPESPKRSGFQSRLLSPTEMRNPRSTKLDRLSVGAAVDLILDEDARIPAAIRKEKAAIEKVVWRIAVAFGNGGRLFYVGAGTSGRLGILDASECPPTFRADPEMVQGIIAGGEAAVFRSIEGAEDDPNAGANAIRFRGVTKKDVVVGIAASGRTPFVMGALRQSRTIGAYTALVCFNPAMKNERGLANVVIAPATGPELLTGSTRMKAGTATKLILNMFTTLAMVRIGKVMGNLMVDLKPSNTKLRDRAVRIVIELTGVAEEIAKTALEETGWVVRKACERLGKSG